jgi:hypothetical protein
VLLVVLESFMGAFGDGLDLPATAVSAWRLVLGFEFSLPASSQVSNSENTNTELPTLQKEAQTLATEDALSQPPALSLLVSQSGPCPETVARPSVRERESRARF